MSVRLDIITTLRNNAESECTLVDEPPGSLSNVNKVGMIQAGITEVLQEMMNERANGIVDYAGIVPNLLYDQTEALKVTVEVKQGEVPGTMRISVVGDYDHLKKLVALNTGLYAVSVKIGEDFTRAMDAFDEAMKPTRANN